MCSWRLLTDDGRAGEFQLELLPAAWKKDGRNTDGGKRVPTRPRAVDAACHSQRTANPSIDADDDDAVIDGDGKLPLSRTVSVY